MKNDRGDGQAKVSDKYHLNSHWHRQANRNDVADQSLMADLPRVKAQIAEWRQDAAIAQAEQRCFDWFHARRDAVLTPENRARWTKGTPAI